MKRSFIIHHLLFTILLLSLLLLPNLGQAQILPACTVTGNCGICDFIDTFVNIIRWILGILAGTALFFLVWHGFSWITARGSQEKVEAGRKGLISTIFGVLIVLVAWQLIGIIITLLVSPPGDETQKLFRYATKGSKVWYEYCGGSKRCQGRGDGSPCGNGNFCFSQECRAKITFEDEDGKRTANNACQYWAMHPTDITGGSNPYTKYGCRNEAECNPNENLGTDYCKGEDVCCEKSESADQ